MKTTIWSRSKIYANFGKLNMTGDIARIDWLVGMLTRLTANQNSEHNDLFKTKKKKNAKLHQKNCKMSRPQKVNRNTARERCIIFVNLFSHCKIINSKYVESSVWSASISHTQKKPERSQPKTSQLIPLFSDPAGSLSR